METHFHQLYPHEFFNRTLDNSFDKWMETWLLIKNAHEFTTNVGLLNTNVVYFNALFKKKT